MIDHVISGISDRLRSNLGYISKIGGVARQQKIKDVASTLIYPAVQDPDKAGNYILMAPDSKETGVMFFEVASNAASDVISGGRGQQFVASIRVICWLNLARITPPDTGAIMAQVVSYITQKDQFESDFVSSVRIVPKSEVPRSPDIFGKYSFKEDVTQFLMLPFDYFAFDFQASYIMNTACRSINFAKIDQQC